jgi:hypothetical protein
MTEKFERVFGEISREFSQLHIWIPYKTLIIEQQIVRYR